MGKQLYELREMLMDELKSITSKGELTAGSLETVDKLTHSIKSIDTICAMEEAGEYSYDGMSYARGRGRNRDSRGRYSSEGGGSYGQGGGSYRQGGNQSNRGGYSSRQYMRNGGGYSGDDKKELIEELRDLMNEASDSRSKMAIQSAIEEMEN